MSFLKLRLLSSALIMERRFFEYSDETEPVPVCRTGRLTVPLLMRKSVRKIVLIFFVTVFGGTIIFFGKTVSAVEHINVNAEGIALTGYDPVAYFKENKPVKGDVQNKLDWKGAHWYFFSSVNRELFRSNPEKYAPQYGGNCAWAVSEGYLAHGNPLVWKIVDGKLYLNFNKPVQMIWEKDIPNHIKKADSNWPTLNK